MGMPSNTKQLQSIFTRLERYNKGSYILDTETTGLGYDAEIVSIAVVHYPSYQTVFHSLVKPSKPIPPEVTRIHGITDEMVKDAPTWPEIRDDFHKSLDQKIPILIYNKDYDIRILEQTDKIYELEHIKLKRTACVMKLYANFHNSSVGYEKKWYKLVDVARKFDLTVTTDGKTTKLVDVAHDSYYDCLMTAGVLLAMTDVFSKNPDLLEDKVIEQKQEDESYGWIGWIGWIVAIIFVLVFLSIM